MLNRKIAPAQHPIQDISLVEPEEIVFENGLRVFVFRAEGQELLKAEFIFQNLFSEPENPLLHTCLSHMIKEGTSNRTSAQIADEIDFYGAYLMPEYSFDQTSLTLYTLNKHVYAVLPIVQDIFCNATFPEAELATYIRNNKQTLQISLQKNDYVARRLFYNYLFGATRYGVTPTEEAYESINRTDLIALYGKQIHPGNCTLILSGNVTPDVLGAMQAHFGSSWKESVDTVAPTGPTFPAFVPSTIVEERPGSLQSAVRLGMPSVNRTHPDFPALQFVNTLFGGYFGSRLMRNVREDKGFTYSIGSALASLKYTGFFTIASEVGVDVTQATLQEIEKEFAQLSASTPSAEEVKLVANYMLGSTLGSLESIFSHADKFKAVYFYGMSLDYYRQYSEIIRTMTPEKAQEIAREYFDYGRLLKVIVGSIQ